MRKILITTCAVIAFAGSAHAGNGTVEDTDCSVFAAQNRWFENRNVPPLSNEPEDIKRAELSQFDFYYLGPKNWSRGYLAAKGMWLGVDVLEDYCSSHPWMSVKQAVEALTGAITRDGKLVDSVDGKTVMGGLN